MPTRTGYFPIGFRQGHSDWQKQSNAELISWAAKHGFEALDLRQATSKDIADLSSAGLRTGTLDLLEMGRLIDSELAERRELIDRNIAHVKELSAAGVKLFFTVIIGSKTLSRRENYQLAVETFTPIADAADAANAKIVIEGWPGPAPSYPALCCTPETCRSFIKDVNPRSIGINYDPSHLIRLGVDPIRFLREFIGSIHHVHAKDTQLFTDAAYEYGLYQPGTFTEPHVYGGQTWRYTIPGHGVTPWTQVFQMLHEAHYPGMVSIELEDENFHGSETAEQEGLKHSLAFLLGA